MEHARSTLHTLLERFHRAKKGIISVYIVLCAGNSGRLRSRITVGLLIIYLSFLCPLPGDYYTHFVLLKYSAGDFRLFI